jgi:hypothetical protein
MGGHAAWRKRVAAGDLAKGSGGAALRHHPHLGRKGADLALNRLGNLGGHGNPKRKRTRKTASINQQNVTMRPYASSYTKLISPRLGLGSAWIALLLILIVMLYVAVCNKSSIKKLFITF